MTTITKEKEPAQCDTKSGSQNCSPASLITNRYNQATPSTLQANGCVISTPFYINPTNDQTKQLLNAFRIVKQKQLNELGFTTTHTTKSGIVVETAKQPPITAIEQDLGMNEEALRYAIFGNRQGIPERLILKLQLLTGVYVVTRQQVVDTFNLWLDHLYTDTTSEATTTTPTKQRKS
jgi:hypothetical protein